MDKYICPNHKNCQNLSCEHKTPHILILDCECTCPNEIKPCIKIENGDILK